MDLLCFRRICTFVPIRIIIRSLPRTKSLKIREEIQAAVCVPKRIFEVALSLPLADVVNNDEKYRKVVLSEVFMGSIREEAWCP